MSTNSERLATIQSDLNTLLEQRIGNLLGVVRAAQEVTRQIIAAEEEIRRQTLVKDQLESDLGPLRSQADDLTVENRELRHRVDALKGNVDRMKTLRDELMSNLSNLKGELEDE